MNAEFCYIETDTGGNIRIITFGDTTGSESNITINKT